MILIMQLSWEAKVEYDDVTLPESTEARDEVSYFLKLYFSLDF